MRLDALLLDAAGTVLSPAESVAETYARTARDHGGTLSRTEVRDRFPTAMRAARQRRDARGDWRSFWAEVVALSTGVDDPALVDVLYARFAEPEAWCVEPALEELVATVRGAGMRLGLVSNWDTRLRPLLEALGIASTFDVLAISGELGLEKPDPAIFLHACTALGVAPERTVHLGDSWAEDVQGARAAGLHAWHLHASDVPTLAAAAARLGAGRPGATG